MFTFSRLPRVVAVAWLGLLAFATCLSLTACDALFGPGVSTVEVTPASNTLVALGVTVRLRAVAKDDKGNPIADKSFTWASSNPATATVNAAGVVTAVANGLVTITATTDAIDGTAAVTVAQAVSRVEVTPASHTLVALGETVQLRAVAKDANGIPIADQATTWATSHPAIATVDAAGLVTAVANGSAAITATADAIGGTASVAVAQAVSRVEVTPASHTLVALGETVQLQAVAKDANGNPINDKTFTWSSSDTNVATLTAPGLASAVSNGSAMILARTDGGDGTVALTVALTCGPAGIVSWWPGNGNALDVIGPNEGTLEYGVGYQPGKVAQAFSFEGVGEHLNAGGTGISLQQVTIEGWVKHASLPASIQLYVTIHPSGPVLRHDGENGFRQLHLYTSIGGVTRSIRVNNALLPGVFHHVAGTFDGSVMRLFLDGVERGSIAVSGTTRNATGVTISGEGAGMDGLMDEMTIYDRALSLAEIQSIYAAGGGGKCAIGR